MQGRSSVLLEICAPTIQSALSAQDGGADRIELCTGLELGGLTPSPALIRMALAKIDIPIMVLIRPRPGGFCYSSLEFEAIKLDIQFCRLIGVRGVVCGLLTRDGHIDLVRMQQLRNEAEGLDFTFHRAFDQVVDPFLATQQLIDLGFNSILTSGQQETAIQGADLISELQDRFGDQIEILAGGGIKGHNLKGLLSKTAVRAVHASASLKIEEESEKCSSSSLFGSFLQTNTEEVWKLRRAIDS